MKYCSNCGVRLSEGVSVCQACGAPVSLYISPTPGMDLAIKIFMVLGCILTGWLIFPLLWTVPMTVSVFRSLDKGRQISNGLRVCVLLFTSLVAGVLLLCRNDMN